MELRQVKLFENLGIPPPAQFLLNHHVAFAMEDHVQTAMQLNLRLSTIDCQVPVRFYLDNPYNHHNATLAKFI